MDRLSSPLDSENEIRGKLRGVFLDTEQSVMELLDEMKKRLEWTEKPLFILNFIAPGIAHFEKFIQLLATHLAATQIHQGKCSGIDQFDEVKDILLKSEGVSIVTDVISAQLKVYDGWFHSQNQGFKEALGQELRQISQHNHGAQIVLVRYFDATDLEQLRKGLARQDFLDYLAKFTGENAEKFGQIELA